MRHAQFSWRGACGAYVQRVTAAACVTVAGLMGSARLRHRPAAAADEVLLPAIAVGDIGFEHVAPCRMVRSCRGQRNYCGDWWTETLKRHVTFES